MANKNIWTKIIKFYKIMNRTIKFYKQFFVVGNIVFKSTNLLLQMSRPAMSTKCKCCEFCRLSDRALSW